MKTYHVQYSYKHNGNICVVDCDIEEVHKTAINAGDTILLDSGVTRTICAENITLNSFLGRCICGDCYRLGKRLVKRVKSLKMGTPAQFGY